jgi:MFS family permease
MTALPLGIRKNLTQFSHQLIQVMLVGFAIGMTRTVVPALAESEFGLERGSFLLLASFVVAFGAVKAVMNFVAGRWSERIGRKWVLFWGWVVALPIPVMIWYAPNWNWIVGATVLLGANQGLCWSMTQTAKLDITKAEERGLAMGLNEFSGYVGVAIAGILTAYAAEWLGARTGLFIFGMAVVLLALLLTVIWVKDTLPWAKAETAAHKAAPPRSLPRYPQGVSDRPSTGEVFALMSWRDRRLFAISQAGLVEKFVDALVWALFPVFLVTRGATLTEVGWIVGVYGFVWGGSQLFTGRLSDQSAGFGRTCWACGSAARASRWWCWVRARSGGRSRPGWRASAWRSSIQTSRRPWPTSLRPPGAARRLASTASGAIWATQSGRSVSASLPVSQAQRKRPSGSSRSRCSSRVLCYSGSERKPTRGSIPLNSRRLPMRDATDDHHR